MPLYGGTSDLQATPEEYVVPSGPEELIMTGGFDTVLTAGSDLNKTADSSGPRNLPWPRILSSMYRWVAGWIPNGYREVHSIKVPGNYGARSSLANFGFRYREFSGGSIASYPGTVPCTSRPMWNNLVPIVYGVRVIDLGDQAQPSEIMGTSAPLPVGGVQFQPAGTASLQENLL